MLLELGLDILDLHGSEWAKRANRLMAIITFFVEVA